MCLTHYLTDTCFITSATSADPDQPAHPGSVIRISTVRFSVKYSLVDLNANSGDPDQTAQMYRLIRICTGRRCNKTCIGTVMCFC